MSTAVNRNAWRHKSVLALMRSAKGRDPEEIIRDKAHARVAAREVKRVDGPAV